MTQLITLGSLHPIPVRDNPDRTSKLRCNACGDEVQAAYSVSKCQCGITYIAGNIYCEERPYPGNYTEVGR